MSRRNIRLAVSAETRRRSGPASRRSSPRGRASPPSRPGPRRFGEVAAAALEGVGHLSVALIAAGWRRGMIFPSRELRSPCGSRPSSDVPRPLPRQVTGLATADAGKKAERSGHLPRSGLSPFPGPGFSSPDDQNCPAGGVAREVAPFAVDHDALVLTRTSPSRPHLPALTWRSRDRWGRLEVQARM